MKRILALALCVVLALALCAPAMAAQVQPTTQNITIDGEAVYCPAYNIDGYNFVKLRTAAALLKDTVCPFDVRYDEATNTVTILRGVPYSGEAEQPGLLVDQSETAVPSAQTVINNDVKCEGITVWNIGGNNWFKLAELAEMIGFKLAYDEDTCTAQITTVPLAWNGAESYAKVYAALCSAGYGSGRRSSAKEMGLAVDEAVEEPAAVPTQAADNAAKGAGDSESGYSGTNTQVEGIDEGDIVKTDGKYLYVLRGDELTILKADGANTAVVSRTKIGSYRYEEQEGAKRYFNEGKNPSEMFVSDGRLCVISNYYSYDSGYVDGKWRYDSKEYTCVDLYDVSDPAAPKALTTLGQDGYVVGSRMRGGKVYLVTNYWVWNWEEDDPATYVPGIYKDGEMHILPVDAIAIAPHCSSTEYVVLCEYDLNGASCTASQSLLGGGDTLYMSDNAIYVMGSRWTDDITDSHKESVYTVEEHTNRSETEIWRFDPANGLRLSASGVIPGYLESQFSADEYNGCLRLVTTRDDNVYRIYSDETYGFTNWQYDDRGRTTGLYVLDGSLTVIGKVDDLAPDERVYSARFDGDIAYFCTFRNVDPLFAVDVSVPSAPKVLSALKISGFSEYLHPWSSGRLFGFGREADEDTGWSEQLKLVMFDTTDKANVTAKHTLLLEDCWYSEALYDHKAFFIDGAKNIIGFVGDNDYYIYSYDDANGFRLQCTFDYDTWPGSVRGFWIGENAYIVGENVVQVLSLNGWTRLLTLDLETK